MICSACGHQGPERAKFCPECGTPAAERCTSCNAELTPAAKFCLECGTQVGGRAAPPSPRRDAEARKVVTIVFADLVGSTALHERLDAESARRLMERYYAALRAAVDAHRGTVVKLLGDGVMAAFGLRQVGEDDALRAVRAAAAMQEAFRALVREQAAALGAVGLRVAVNTGEVVVSGAQDDVIGDPVNVAARLQEQARDGDVVLGEATRRLVATRVTLAPLGSLTLKGRAEAVSAHRLVSLDPPAATTAAPFVGREDEIRRLHAVYDAAAATPAARLAVLVGSPGLGKSRLIDELARRHVATATILAAHCDAAGGATFAPLAMAVRAFLGLDDGVTGEPVRAAVAAALPPGGDENERARIAAGMTALLGGSPTSPEETFFVVRRFLAGLATTQPVILVIDDLHWAEPLLLDLVEHLVQWGGGVPLFVLVGARPELRDLRSTLVTPGGLVAEVVTLGGLDAGAAMRLAANVIGAADLPAAVAAKVLATSEGNPLFVGELVRMLVQEGALTREGDRWIVGAGLAALEMPPTIHALLAARIERLRPEERAVLERAAVVGRHFSRSAVAALLERNGADLDARLEALHRSELIERDTGWLLGEPALRFHHVLIRDAAYRRLLKGTRAELHARLADWIGARVGDAPEHDETIGRHLEQAHQHLSELGPIDADGRVLGERASRHLAAAGRRALAGDDVPLAAGLLGRAIERLDASDATRAELSLDWCEALLAAGDVGPATRAIGELARFLPDAPRLAAWHTCFAGQLIVLTAPEALQTTADGVAAAAVEFAKLGDAAGEAKAHQVHAQALARLGRVGACEAALDRALAAARKAGDRRRANAVLAGAPLAALWGPSPVTRASGRCLDVVRVLRITQGAPAVEAVALSCQGVLEALRGRTDAARRMIASSRKMVEDLGITHRLLEADAFAGRIDLLEGDTTAAERNLRGAYEGLRDLGLGIDAARAAALLARALLAQGKAVEAEALSRESEALAGDDLQAAIAWRGVRAEALAERGEHAAAVELAQAAVAIAAATDALLDHADARLALAAALRAAGRSNEADAEKRRATELWDAKGATLLAERARSEEGRAPIPLAIDSRVESPHAVQRRVRPNAATAAAVQFDIVFASGDVAKIEAAFVHAPGVSVVDHPTESTYGRDGAIESFRRLLRLKDPVVRHEPLATLGDSLGLCRRYISSGGTTGGRFDVADYQREEYVVVEPGVVIEIFAGDRLDDAVACLYGRYAQLLPDGPERQRAALTARSVTGWAATDLERLATTLDPSYRCVDHRVLHTWSARDGAEVLAQFRIQLELAPDFAFRWEDVIALAPHALLVRGAYFGSDRAGGGRFENRVCMLTVFGAEGRVTSADVYEAESTTEALARFDELTGTASKRPVRPNAATATLARFDAAITARDDAALRELMSDDLKAVDHPNGVAYGRDEVLDSFRRLLRMRDPSMRHEPLATRADALVLATRRIAASGTGGRIDVGEYEREEIGIYEVDARGRFLHVEVFAAARAAEAFARFDELSAASAPARRRVRANAATKCDDLLHAAIASRDVEAFAAQLAEPLEFVHHPTQTTFGRSGTVVTWRSILRAEHLTYRQESLATLGDSLALNRQVINLEGLAEAHLRSVGAVEVEEILLTEVDDQGQVTRFEVFAPDRLHDAIHRLYERYAERLPVGPARDRAAATARSALAPDFTGRTDDVLVLEPHGLLVRENSVCALYLYGGDGLLTHTEVFEAEREAEALARFDDLLGNGESAAPGPPRRVHPNVASTLAARFQAAFAAGDDATIADLFATELEVVDHQNGATYGRDGHLASVRRLRRARDPVLRFEPIATLGEGLCLSRRHITASGTGSDRFDVGEYEREEIVLFGVEENRFRQIDIFAADRLRGALARLYERWAESLPEGPARKRATGSARALAAIDGTLDDDRIVSVYAPSFECIDHRTLATWTAHGVEEWRTQFRQQTELVLDFALRDDDVLALDPTVLVVRETFFGTARTSGGAFENVVLCVIAFGADGLVTRTEVFEPGQEAAALACFDALVGNAGTTRAPTISLVANAATRFNERFASAWAARDWDAVAAIHASALQIDDRRRLLQMHGAAEGFMAALRVFFDVPGSRWVVTPIATRGERLALSRVVFEGEVEGGGGALDYLTVDEVDADGRRRGVVAFDLDDLDAAFAELDRRWDAGEGAAHAGVRRAFHAFPRAVVSRDWEPMVALCTPALVQYDHRAFAVLGTTRGTEAWTRNFRTLTDLAPDTIWRIDHFRSAARGFCMVARWQGTREGGRYEIPVIAINEVDERDRIARIDLYDVDCLDAARARFEELMAPVASRERFANAASASAEAVSACLLAHDWQGFAACFSDAFRMSDRRRLVQLELDRDRYVAFTREVAEGRTGRMHYDLLATRGERLALTRPVYEFTGGDVGPSEIAFLILMEVDARGRVVANVRWDVDDLDAAYAELDARWTAGEAAAHPLASKWIADYERFFAGRDWTGMAAIMAPDLVSHSHRLVSWGTLHGPSGLVSTMEVQMALAPDTRVRLDHVRTCAGGVLLEYTWLGTREGGAFENLLVAAIEIDALGRARRVDVWEAEQLESARARFAELSGRGTSTEEMPVRFANAATRAVDRGTAALAGRDWEGFAALTAPGFRHYDRTRIAQIETDGRQWLASFRQIVEMTSSRPEQRLLATRGDRLALFRMLWRGAEGDIGPSEIDWILVVEVDDRGDHVAVVAFDPEDLAAAYAELEARWAAGEAAAHPLASRWLVDYLRFFATRDWPAMTALFAPDLLGENHRLVGWGTLHGPAAVVSTLQAQIELAPETQERVDHVRTGERAVLLEYAWHGTREGGAFENVWVVLVELDADGRGRRADVWEPGQLAQARARFEALCTSARLDPLAVIAKPNAATAALDRWEVFDVASESAWEALREGCAPGLIFEDRQGFARLSGDRTMMIASLRERVASGARVERRLMGTAGERVAIARMLWSGGPSDGRFEIEYLSVVEVDEAALVTAIILFGADDARAAQREAWARWAAIDPTVEATLAVVGEASDAFNAQDRVRLRAVFADDLVAEDHRGTGTGRIEGGSAYADSLAVPWDLADGTRVELGSFWLACDRSGALYTVRRTGRVAGGGPFESDYLQLMHHACGRFTHVEQFELDDVDAARARFEELGAARTTTRGMP